MARKKEKNQLERNLFYNTVVILFCLFCVFLLFSNLDFLWERVSLKKESVQVSGYETLNKLEENKKVSPKQPVIYFWGDTDADIMVKHQLDNMKEAYVQVDDIKKCVDAEILFAHKKMYSREEILHLRYLSQHGTVICMLGLPQEESLNVAHVKLFLGIAECKTETEKTGYRLAEKILFGRIYESEENFQTMDIELKQRTEVYVSALEEEEAIENYNLTPLFWRYKESEERNSVYVIDEVLLQNEVGYALISFLMSDIYGTYMYPVVNAYCFAVQGMPFSEKYESDFLHKKYGKDSLGVENDILFPEVKRCEEKYGVFSTLYSREAESIKETENTLLQYYLEDIKRSEGVIGSYTDENGCQVDIPYANRLKVWTPEFSWKEGEVIQIPYDEMSDEAQENLIIQDMGEARASGFHCVSVDMDAFLYEDTSFEWIEYVKKLETILGTEKKELYWLDRMTVDDAVYRIKSHEIMQPVFTYEEDRILVEILNFSGDAFFYLYTDKEVDETIGAECLKISDGIYFVSTKNANLEIKLSE